MSYRLPGSGVEFWKRTEGFNARTASLCSHIRSEVVNTIQRIGTLFLVAIRVHSAQQAIDPNSRFADELHDELRRRTAAEYG